MIINQLPERELRADAALWLLQSGEFAYTNYGTGVTKFVTPSAVQQAFTNTGMDSGWLQPGTIRAGWMNGAYFCALVVPARQLYIELSGSELFKGTYLLPVPHTFMFATGSSFRIFALKGPYTGPTDQLYNIPFPNSYDDGHVCWGGNRRLELDPANPMAAWNLYFEAPFNGHVADGRCKSEPDDVRRLLVKLADRESFPDDELVPADYATIDAFMHKMLKAGQ